MLSGVQEELKTAKEQNRHLEEQLMTSRVDQERLENSISLAETEKSVLEESAKTLGATIDKNVLEIERLQGESSRLQGLARRLEISSAAAEKVSRH